MKIILRPGELSEEIRCGLGMSSTEFVVSAMRKIVDKSSSSADFNNFSGVLDDVDGPARKILKSFVSEPQSECIKLFSGLIDCWVGFAVETFPKSAAGISRGELLFQEKKRKLKLGFV